MELQTISAYETTAEEFFGHLRKWQTDLVLDTRLKNTNQLAGFTKKSDLEFFVPQLTGARYEHDLLFAPAPTKLERYLNGNIDWTAYALSYEEDLTARHAPEQFFQRYGTFSSIALLGTETKKRRSHTEMLVAILKKAQAK